MPPSSLAGVLSQRWSPRAFSKKGIEAEQLKMLFEAARWAPSSFNAQPWSFLVFIQQNPQEHAQFVECLLDFNRVWAQRAPVLILSVAQLNFPHNGKPNRHAFYDVGLAVAQLTVQAMSMGLYLRQMGGFSMELVRERYHIPESHEPVAAMALGYLGDVTELPEELQKREAAERERKPLREMVFTGQWKQEASWTNS